MDPVAFRLDSDEESECDLEFHDIEVEYLDHPLQDSGREETPGTQHHPLQYGGGASSSTTHPEDATEHMPLNRAFSPGPDPPRTRMASNSPPPSPKQPDLMQLHES